MVRLLARSCLSGSEAEMVDPGSLWRLQVQLQQLDLQQSSSGEEPQVLLLTSTRSSAGPQGNPELS